MPIDSAISCCDGLGLEKVDFSKVSLWPLTEMEGLINWSDPNLHVAATLILLKPLYWNAVGRLEYYTHVVSKLCGTPYRGCILFALSILLFGYFRDSSYHSVIQSQPKLEILEHPAILVLSLAVFAIGSTLVLTSFWALGFIGTFLGDYFGLYLDERVTGFPFSVFEHPMYTGVVFNLLGAALWYASPVGIFLTVFASLVYKLVVQFEGPFTAAIYDKKAAKENEEKTQ